MFMIIFEVSFQFLMRNQPEAAGVEDRTGV
jgi:hypothetical protein